MSKSFWIGSMALLLLTAPAQAADAKDGPGQKGPGGVEVRTEAISGPDQRAPVRVYVHEEQGPGGMIRVQAVAEEAGPIQPDGLLPKLPAAPAVSIKLGEYWLGLGCSPARGALRTQLELPEDQGLVVEQVVPDGPAAKAEIKPHDVLLKAGERPLKNVQDLIDAVQAAKDKEISIELIRGAKPQQVTVTPAKRPAEARPDAGWEGPGKEAVEAYRRLLEGLDPQGGEDARNRALKLFERLQPGEALKGPMRWRFFGPGAILPPDAWPRPPLPENMSITISKQGDEPAQIKVKQGDQAWEVNERELEKLPEKVRQHVEQMLGHVSAAPMDRQIRRFDFAPDSAPVRPEGPPEVRPPQVRPEGPPQARLEGRLEKRLEEMDRRIEQLRKSIEELREGRPRLQKAPEENSERL